MRFARYFASPNRLAMQFSGVSVVFEGDEALATFTRSDRFQDLETGRDLSLEVRVSTIVAKADGAWKIKALRKQSWNRVTQRLGVTPPVGQRRHSGRSSYGSGFPAASCVGFQPETPCCCAGAVVTSSGTVSIFATPESTWVFVES